MGGIVVKRGVNNVSHLERYITAESRLQHLLLPVKKRDTTGILPIRSKQSISLPLLTEDLALQKELRTLF